MRRLLAALLENGEMQEILVMTVLSCVVCVYNRHSKCIVVDFQRGRHLMPSTNSCTQDFRRDAQRIRFNAFAVNTADVRYKKFARVLASIEPGNMLEIGCADGGFLSYLNSIGWETHGIEIAPNLVQRGRDAGLDVQEYDAQQPLPYRRESFDAIVAGEVIEHMIDVSAFLGNCRDVLKPDGWLIVSTPNLVSLKNRILMLLGHRPRFAYSDQHYSMFVADDLIAKIGGYFDIFSVKGSYIIASTTRSRLFQFFEALADSAPTLSEHLIVVAKKRREHD